MPYEYPDYRQFFNGNRGSRTPESVRNEAFQPKSPSQSGSYNEMGNAAQGWRDMLFGGYQQPGLHFPKQGQAPAGMSPLTGNGTIYGGGRTPELESGGGSPFGNPYQQMPKGKQPPYYSYPKGEGPVGNPYDWRNPMQPQPKPGGRNPNDVGGPMGNPGTPTQGGQGAAGQQVNWMPLQAGVSDPNANGMSPLTGSGTVFGGGRTPELERGGKQGGNPYAQNPSGLGGLQKPPGGMSPLTGNGTVFGGGRTPELERGQPVNRPEAPEPNWQALADRYSQNAGYGYLKTHPELIQKYQTWAYDPAASNEERQRRQATHITKWLSDNGYHQFYTQQAQRDKMAGRGYKYDLAGNLVPINPPQGGGAPGGGGATPPPDTPPPTPGDGTGMQSDYLSYLENMLRQSNDRKRTEGERALRSAMAYGNYSDSGASLDAMGDFYAANTAAEQGTLANMLFQASEGNQERILKKLLGEMGLEGTKYSADAGVTSAGIGANASMYGADQQLRGLMEQLGVQQQGNLLDYNLGIYGINNQAYGMDLQNQQFLMNLLANQGAQGLEALLGLFGGYPNPIIVS